MVLPSFVRSLSESALRALPYVRSGLQRGLSLNTIQRSLKGTPFSVRRQDLLDIARYHRQSEESAAYLEGLRRDLLPDARRLAPATTRTLRRYSLTFRATGTNLLSGETETRYVNVSTSQLRTLGELEDLAADIVSDAEVYEPFTIAELVPAGGTVRGDLGSFV